MKIFSRFISLVYKKILIHTCNLMRDIKLLKFIKLCIEARLTENEAIDLFQKSAIIRKCKEKMKKRQENMSGRAKRWSAKLEKLSCTYQQK